VTIGIAIYPQGGSDMSSLIGNAEAALYRAKAEARGSIRLFELAMDMQLRDKRVLQQDLRTAISRDDLTLHDQPQARIYVDEIEAPMRSSTFLARPFQTPCCQCASYGSPVKPRFVITG